MIQYYAVFMGNKQIKVFPVESPELASLAKSKAVTLAKHNGENGYHCTVEEVGISEVGCLVYSTDSN